MTRTEVLARLPSVRGLRREEAAAYVGFSASKFDALVRDGIMPKPGRFGGCTVWDRLALDRAFDRAFGMLPTGVDENPWDAE